MLKKLGKDVVLYGLGDALGKVANLALLPLIAQKVSPETFGLYDLLLTLVALFGVFCSCGMNSALQRYYWDSETRTEERPIMVSSGLMNLMLIGGGFLLLALFFRRSFESVSSLEVFMVGLLILFQQLLQYFLDVTRLHFAPVKFLWISGLARIGTPCLILVLIHFHGAQISSLLGAQVLVLLLVLPLALYLIRQDLKWGYSWLWGRKLLEFGFPLAISGLGYWVFSSTDRWMLGGMSSIEEVGLYSMAMRFSSVILFFSMAFGQAWSPYAMKLKAEQPGTYQALYFQIFCILILGMLIPASFLGLFSTEIFSLLLPEAYFGGRFSLVFLALAGVAQASQQITAIGISIAQKTRYIALVTWLGALFNFGLNFWLIPEFGATAAAGTTLLTHAFVSGMYLYFTQKFHPIRVRWSLALGLGVAYSFSIALCFAANAGWIQNVTSSWKLGIWILGNLLLAGLVWPVLRRP